MDDSKPHSNPLREYDPDDKTENGGKEHHARRLIRERVFSDPFSDAFRRTRRTLLALSVLALILNADLALERFPYIGEPPTTEGRQVLLGLVAIGLSYFLINFLVVSAHEYQRWRTDGYFHTLQSCQDWIQKMNEHTRRIAQEIDADKNTRKANNLARLVEEARADLPDLQTRLDRTYRYYQSISRLQILRIFGLDLLVPLGVAGYAMIKSIALAPDVLRALLA